MTPTTTNPRRILAVDYGRRKIGLALSDELCLTAHPLATMLRVNRRTDLRRLSEICRRYSVVRIIVGHPLRLRGEAGEMAAETARFAAKLKKEIGIETELVDERLTSWEAERIVAETRPSRRRERKPLDHFAAAILLRDYLDHKGRRSSAAQSEKD